MIEYFINEYGYDLLVVGFAGGMVGAVAVLSFYIISYVWSRSKLLVVGLSLVAILAVYPELFTNIVRNTDQLITGSTPKIRNDLIGSPQEMGTYITACQKDFFIKKYEGSHQSDIPPKMRQLGLPKLIAGVENSRTLHQEIAQDVWTKFDLSSGEIPKLKSDMPVDEYIMVLAVHCMSEYVTRKRS